MSKLNKNKQEKLIDFEKFDKKRLVFAAGRLTKQKNFSYLIDEFCLFSKKNVDFILLILGEGEEKNKLKQKIKNLNIENKVHLIGNVKDVYNYFKQGEVFILSSLWEEVGFVMIEAAFSNLFIISSDCPNGPKEFLDNDNNGILFKNNKIGELTKSLEKYINIENNKKYRIKAKKNTRKYTRFMHNIELNKILK